MLKTFVMIAIMGINGIALAQPYPEMVSGVIIGISDPYIAIETSSGTQLIVDITDARTGDHIGSPIDIGRPVVVHGQHQGDKFIAEAIHKGQPPLLPSKEENQ